MEETANSSVTDKPWLFQKGQSGNPSGRPKGKSLKDYSREMLSAMTEDERQTFLEGIPKEIIWKLAEGNPANNTDITSGGKPLILPATLINKNDTPRNSGDSSPEQSTV